MRGARARLGLLALALRGGRGARVAVLELGLLVRVRALGGLERGGAPLVRLAERGLGLLALFGDGALELAPAVGLGRLDGLRVLLGGVAQGLRVRLLGGDARLARGAELLFALGELRRDLLGAGLEVVGALGRELAIGAQRVDLRRELVLRALEVEELVGLIGLLALEHERLIADVEELLVLARELIAEAEQLFVLLVERLAQVEELAARHGAGLAAAGALRVLDVALEAERSPRGSPRAPAPTARQRRARSRRPS